MRSAAASDGAIKAAHPKPTQEMLAAPAQAPCPFAVPRAGRCDRHATRTSAHSWARSVPTAARSGAHHGRAQLAAALSRARTGSRGDKTRR